MEKKIYNFQKRFRITRKIKIISSSCSMLTKDKIRIDPFLRTTHGGNHRESASRTYNFCKKKFSRELIFPRFMNCAFLRNSRKIVLVKYSQNHEFVKFKFFCLKLTKIQNKLLLCKVITSLLYVYSKI